MLKFTQADGLPVYVQTQSIIKVSHPTQGYPGAGALLTLPGGVQPVKETPEQVIEAMSDYDSALYEGLK